MPKAYSTQVHLLITPVGLPQVFNGWNRESQFSTWTVVTPKVVGLDAQSPTRAMVKELAALVTDRDDVRMVCAGDGAHLGLHLLSMTASGRCALVNPPVTPLLSDATIRTKAQSGLSRVASMRELDRPLRDVTRAAEAGLSEEDRLRVVLSSLKDEITDETPENSLIRSMLDSYQESLDAGDGQKVERIDPWWLSKSKLLRTHVVRGWLPQAFELPQTDVEPVKLERTNWPTEWWKNPEEVVEAVVSFIN